VEREDPHAEQRIEEDRLTNVVRLPVDWLGPREDLVPFGVRASDLAMDADVAVATDPAPSRAADFWGEGSAALQDALEAPSIARHEPPGRGAPAVEAHSTQAGEPDRSLQEQVTSVPQAPAAQTLPRDSASLEIETDPEVRVERAPRTRALRVRVPRTRAAHSEPREPGHRRALSGWERVTRTRAATIAALIVLPVVGIAIAITGGSPAHRPRPTAASSSASASFAGLLDASLSMAGRIPSIERITVGAGRPRRRSHRTHRAPRRHPITHPITHPPTQPAASSGSAAGSSYTARFATQTDSSPAATESSPASPSTGGGSSVQSGPPQSRTGPTGPISLIGAGTTPSG
jgi:hypothetical protein